MLIGITGYKRSGKDTLARGLCEALGLEQFSYAGPIREMVAKILDISLDELERTKEEPVSWLNGITPRYMMQTLGTEWGRDMIDPFLWGKVMFHRMPSGRGVTSDVRFEDEARALLDRGGVIIRVVRPDLALTPGHDHVSEQPIDMALVTHTVTNDKAPEDMIQEALRLLRS